MKLTTWRKQTLDSKKDRYLATLTFSCNKDELADIMALFMKSHKTELKIIEVEK